jgi:lipoprotein-anchoring transpeptidase ErfK/SrfK
VVRGRRVIIGASIAAVVSVGAIGAYAYDRSQRHTIADGVRVGGIDLGGADPAQARARLRTRLLASLRRPVTVVYHDHRFRLSARRARVAVDLDALVDEALRRSREGSIFARLGREIAGGGVDADIAPRVSFDHAAVRRFVAGVAARLDRAPRDATLDFQPASLAPVPEQDGVTVLRRPLSHAVVRALTHAQGARKVAVQARTVAPKVKAGQLVDRYGTVVTVDRANFKLRLFKRLKLVKTYPIAVGRQGLETPGGVYTVRDKQVNPAWHVPNSSWAGDLAGKVIPPGPADPIKARWIGIVDGAGIHGTNEIGSLGSAASHGCIRMAIPDVIELFDRTPYGSTIFVA